jgi:hypothetical protein
MDESKDGRLRRRWTCLAVLALHAAFIAAILMMPFADRSRAAAAHSIEIFLLPRADLPRMAVEQSRPKRVLGPSILIAPPTLDMISLPTAVNDGHTAASDGTGPGVDWGAEARRAVKAFEIRSHQAENGQSVSGSPAEDHWWPRPHHTGEKFKTTNGDWIVWINTDCYQVAGSGSALHALSATPPQTICPGESTASDNGLPVQPGRNTPQAH